MKTFKEFIDNKNSFLCESSWSRVLQHIENNKSFAVISAYTKNVSDKENQKEHENLLREIKKLGYGFIELDSGYSYKKSEKSKERIIQEESFFIPNITYKNAIKLGVDFKQESILFKDENGFKLIFTENKNDHKIGDVDMEFQKKYGGKNITFNPEVLKYAFSRLKKGTKSQTSQNFAFVGECELSYLNEIQIPSWCEAMANAVKKQSVYTKKIRIL